MSSSIAQTPGPATPPHTHSTPNLSNDSPSTPLTAETPFATLRTPAGPKIAAAASAMVMDNPDEEPPSLGLGFGDVEMKARGSVVRPILEGRVVRSQVEEEEEEMDVGEFPEVGELGSMKRRLEEIEGGGRPGDRAHERELLAMVSCLSWLPIECAELSR